LPEEEQRFVVQREERAAQRRKDTELVVGPFDRGERGAQRDNLFAVVKRSPADEDMRDAPSFEGTDVAARDVAPEAAEPAEEDRDMSRPDRRLSAVFLDGPAAFVDQPMDKGRGGTWKGFVYLGVNAGEKMHRRAGVKLHHSGMEGRPRMRGTRLISVIVNSAFQFDQ
jgi:hypothetical protein